MSKRIIELEYEKLEIECCLDCPFLRVSHRQHVECSYTGTTGGKEQADFTIFSDCPLKQESPDA
jgi:hypothetical protein